MMKNFILKNLCLLCTFMALFTFSCSSHTALVKRAIPTQLPDPAPISSPIRLALVLGEGGAKGMAHLGVLYELEKAKIPIDLIVGCSIGSFVGALYADHPNAQDLKEKLFQLRSRKLLSFSPFSTRRGIWRDKSLEKFLKQNLSAAQFDQLQIPLIVVSTDLFQGKSVYLRGGPLIPTICASCAIPFFFQPRELYGRVLVDGMLTDPIPIKIAKEQNPCVTVAVDLSGLLVDKQPKNLFQITKRSFDILRIQHSQNSTQAADIIIKPKIRSNISFLDTRHHQILFEAGQQAAREVIERIEKKLEKSQD